MALVPGILRNRFDPATLEILAKQERKEDIVYFVKSDHPLNDARLTISETPTVYVGRSTVEELFLLLADERIEHVHIGKKYVPFYR